MILVSTQGPGAAAMALSEVFDAVALRFGLCLSGSKYYSRGNRLSAEHFLAEDFPEHSVPI